MVGEEGGGGVVDRLEGEWWMTWRGSGDVWRGSGGRYGGGVVDDMEGEWWMIWRGSGGVYGGGVVGWKGEWCDMKGGVVDIIRKWIHRPLPLHIKMKVRRTHTHILVRVMTGQKMAQNQESCGGAS